MAGSQWKRQPGEASLPRTSQSSRHTLASEDTQKRVRGLGYQVDILRGIRLHYFEKKKIKCGVLAVIFF